VTLGISSDAINTPRLKTCFLELIPLLLLKFSSCTLLDVLCMFLMIACRGKGKIPRWEPRSRVAVYLGHSPHHAQSVALVLNLATGHVSPQFHMVFDDDFTTISHLKLGTVPKNWPELYKNNRELLTDEPFHLNGEWTHSLSTQPSVQWLSATLDSQPTTFDNLLDSTASSTSFAGKASPHPAHAAQSEASIASQSEGDIVVQDEGVLAVQDEGVDPITGDDYPSCHNFSVDFDASLHMPEPINFSEAGLRRSSRNRKPTD
jgi:hypothetical protein